MSDSDEFRTFLETLKLSAKKVDAIVEEFERRMPGEVRALLPSTSRGAVVETVEAYGLAIDVDANGRAQRVALAGGFGMASTTDTLDVEYWD